MRFPVRRLLRWIALAVLPLACDGTSTISGVDDAELSVVGSQNHIDRAARTILTKVRGSFTYLTDDPWLPQGSTSTTRVMVNERADGSVHGRFTSRVRREGEHRPMVRVVGEITCLDVTGDVVRMTGIVIRTTNQSRVPTLTGWFTQARLVDGGPDMVTSVPWPLARRDNCTELDADGPHGHLEPATESRIEVWQRDAPLPPPPPPPPSPAT